MENKNYHEISVINVWTAYHLGWITFEEALEKIRLLTE